MKYYVVQIDPESQESPLMIDGLWPDDLAAFGNRHYQTEIPTNIEPIKEALDQEEVYDFLESPAEIKEFFGTATKMMHQYFERKKPYSTKEVHQLKQLVKDYAEGRDCDKDETLCKVLNIVLGGHWKDTTIRGCCQGDWQNVIYKEETHPGGIKWFESEYFNEGSEWMVHDGDDVPETPQDITGYTVYCHEYGEDSIREELSKAIGCDPADIVMYIFDRYARVPIYKTA